MSSRDDLLVPKHGGYRHLKSFQIAQLAYDLTVRFCELYIDRKSRTRDQMVQAARSGVQNIAEGSQASGTSKKMELKLTNVARASLEELRLDYEDFLRHRGVTAWGAGHPALKRFKAKRCATLEAVQDWVLEERQRARDEVDYHGEGLGGPGVGEGVGEGETGADGRTGTDGLARTDGLTRTGTDEHGQDTEVGGRSGAPAPDDGSGRTTPTSDESVPVREGPCSSVSGPCQSSPATSPPTLKPVTAAQLAANAALSLLNLACYLLDRQLQAQAAAFETEGGFTERLYRVRSSRRNGPKQD